MPEICGAANVRFCLTAVNSTSTRSRSNHYHGECILPAVPRYQCQRCGASSSSKAKYDATVEMKAGAGHIRFGFGRV